MKWKRRTATGDRTEIFHTGEDQCADTERLINGSNSGEIFNDENGLPVCTFSMTMESPAWTIVQGPAGDFCVRKR